MIDQRPHAPLRRLHGVECSRCGMREAWAGWREACPVSVAAAPAPGSPEHAAHIARVTAWKARNPERVRAAARARRAATRELACGGQR